MPGPERRLAAILSADVVGYSRLRAEDEDGPRAAFSGRSATGPSLRLS